MTEERRAPHNRILLELDPTDLGRIYPLLEWAELRPVATPTPAQWLLSGLWFPDSGLVSARTCNGVDLSTEVAMIGCEAVAGVPLGGFGQCRFVALAHGLARVIIPENVPRALDLGPSLRTALDSVTARLIDQMAATAHANASGRVVERLARWLLMAHERVEGDALFLTHETLSRILGVRRVGVTNALQLLERRNQLSVARGHIRIVDRDGLIESAGGLYCGVTRPGPSRGADPCAGASPG